MSTAPGPSGLHMLSRPQGHAVPPPKSRWRTRIALPAIILLAVTGVLAWAARDTLRPAITVTVAPVVAREIETASNSQPSTAHAVAVQAPGWIEPSPYAISVAALAEGVAEEVLFLEGQRVTKGDVMVRMVDADAKLGLARINAEFDSLTAAVDRAKAQAASEKARVAELEDEERRTAQSAAGAAATESELIRVRARLDAQRAALAAAEAAVAEAVATRQRCQVMCDESQLTLDRMTITAPSDGVVLARLIEPGTRISLSDSQGAMANTMGVVARIYDPANLQVRVDVPLADAAMLIEGMPAEIETEAVPNHTFHGSITRIVHEANIQRNTIQVKVAIDDPLPTLKPEMLARVRLLSSAAASNATPASNGTASLLVPRAALVQQQGTTARVWLLDQRTQSVSQREITLTGATLDSHAIASSGLAPGDRVIINPPVSLRDASRVRAQETR